MFQHNNSNSNQYSPDSLAWLGELHKHPNPTESAKHIAKAIEYIHQVQLLQREFTQQPNDRTDLIAAAMALVRRLGIINPPYFESMSNESIRDFIAKYSTVNQEQAN
jgi:hypothetical protein